ncbi:MAG: alanine--tRNA ligase [Candidatus Bathyarchaeota archaeon]|nr:MAG: alanine--tRNA ligase [Candidatus Bathyarchaeota archaeon]
MKRFPESEYYVPFFDEYEYLRKLCPICGKYFWTQNHDQETCGESTPEGCAPLSFIENSPTRRHYSLQEVREAFLSFFGKQGHERVNPYPVVARWRDDLYFTHASIIDFQPYVTDGVTPPPANPLVISQPCIRFIDVDNVGPTFGRHLTIFEMGGHHAFNYPDKEVYWKDQTVRYHHEFVTKELGVKSEEVIYKEDVWSGGGNAGPDLESIVRGLELATLVFMKFKVINRKFVELPLRTVDTGYGMERYTWLSQGLASCFHAVYAPVLDKVLKMAGLNRVDNKLLARVAEESGVMNVEKTADRSVRTRVRERVAAQVGISFDQLDKAIFPVESAFAAVDHTKCLLFMLAEGVVPSNVHEGYLTRLMIRRTYRLLKVLRIERELPNIIDMQIKLWSKDFPHLKEMQGEILEMLSVEQEKFTQTLKKGASLIKRIAEELKTKAVSQFPVEKLIELYDSHGLPPEVVQETAENSGLQVSMPEDFYKMIAERHVQVPPQREMEKIKGLEAKISDLQKTQTLYYEDSYRRRFEACVLRVVSNKYVVLEKTAFYPEGGGQPADHGHLEFAGKSSEVVDVQKLGNVIVHVLKAPLPKEGDVVKGIIDWKRRGNLMKQHTATHIINGAARHVLGQHVWQCGAQKGLDRSRLDISHFRRLTLEETQKIEATANEVVAQNLSVETSWMPRGKAEKLHGFRLYQGGVVPGKDIRVVKIGDWNVEACAGMHLKNTKEIGFIKVIHTERIQDGVERIVFSAGLPALKPMQETDRLLWKLSEILNAPREKLEQTAKRFMREWKEARHREKQLVKEIAVRESLELKGSVEAKKGKRIEGANFLAQKFKSLDVDRMIQTASEVVKAKPDTIAVFYAADDKNASVVVMAGKDAVEMGIDASEIAKETASVLGGGGSGRPDFAQGGGPLTNNISKVQQKAEEVARKQLGKR